MNGIWCLLLLGRWTMFTGWADLVRRKIKPDTEFVSADVSRTFIKTPGAGTYEMLSRDRDNIRLNTDSKSAGTKMQDFSMSPITPLSPAAQQPTPSKSGRETPDYFGKEARYKSPTRSFSSPKPPHASTVTWDSQTTHAMPSHLQPTQQQYYQGMDPLSMNKI